MTKTRTLCHQQQWQYDVLDTRRGFEARAYDARHIGLRVAAHRVEANGPTHLTVCLTPLNLDRGITGKAIVALLVCALAVSSIVTFWLYYNHNHGFCYASFTTKSARCTTEAVSTIGRC
jgi:hypothetical protein